MSNLEKSEPIDAIGGRLQKAGLTFLVLMSAFAVFSTVARMLDGKPFSWAGTLDDWKFPVAFALIQLLPARWGRGWRLILEAGVCAVLIMTFYALEYWLVGAGSR